MSMNADPGSIQADPNESDSDVRSAAPVFDDESSGRLN